MSVIVSMIVSAIVSGTLSGTLSITVPETVPVNVSGAVSGVSGPQLWLAPSWHWFTDSASKYRTHLTMDSM